MARQREKLRSNERSALISKSFADRVTDSSWRVQDGADGRHFRDRWIRADNADGAALSDCQIEWDAGRVEFRLPELTQIVPSPPE